MKKRLDALKRIGRLQDRMRDLALWRATAIEREREGAADDLKSLFDAMEDSPLAYGATAAFGAGRARALERRIAKLSADHEIEAGRAKAEAMRAKLAEQAIDRAAARHRAQIERRELVELIEWTLRRRGSSPG